MSTRVPNCWFSLLVRWTLVVLAAIALFTAVPALRELRAADPEAEDEGPPVATGLMLDLQGKVLVYGSSLGAGATPAAMAGPANLSDDVDASNPSTALRLAALKTARGDLAEAARLLGAVNADPTIQALAEGLAPDAEVPAVTVAAEAAESVQPLWARRAFRLALLERAGDEQALARERDLVLAEAPEQFGVPMAVMAAVALILALSVLAWLAGLAALAIWLVTRSGLKAATVPPTPAEPGGGLQPDSAPQPDAAVDRGSSEAAPDRIPLLTAFEMLFVYVLGQAAIAFALSAVLGSMMSGTVLIFVSMGLSISLAAAFAQWRLGPNYLAALGFRRTSPWKAWLWAWGGILLLPAAVIGTALLQSALTGRPAQSENPVLGLFVDERGLLARLLMFICVAIFAPLVEEGLFRGALYGALRSVIGPAGAVILSSIAFGLVHFDPNALASLALIGAAAAILREVTGNLWASVILHGLWNGATVVLLMLLSG